VANARKKLDREQSPDTFQGSWAIVTERVEALETKVTENLPNLTEDGLDSLLDCSYNNHSFPGGKHQGEHATFQLTEAEQDLLKSVVSKRKSDFRNEDAKDANGKPTEEAERAKTTRQAVGKLIGHKDTRFVDRPKVSIETVDGNPALVVASKVSNDTFTRNRSQYVKALVETAERK
jgi:hypothetical protein